MGARRLTERGLLALASALVLSLVSFVLPYIWDALLGRGTTEVVLGQSLHTLWIPVLSYLVDAAILVLGLVGFLLVWSGRWEFGPAYASRAGLALLAVVVAAGVLVVWTATGMLLGFFRGLSDLIPWRSVMAFAVTALLGFALYWILGSLPVLGTRPSAAVAFALGVAGGAVTLLTTVSLRRAQALALEGAGAALSLVSLILWFALCLWDSRSLGSGRVGPPSAAPTGGS